MRPFNSREKNIIQKIATIGPDNKDFFDSFLRKNIFTIESNMAVSLLTQLSGQGDLILYIASEEWNSGSQNLKLYEFLEMICLFDYLKQEKYIMLFSLDSLKKRDGIIIIHQSLAMPSDPSKGKLILNNQEDYLEMSSPDKIYNVNGALLFKGIHLDSSLYNLALDSLTGLVYPTEGLIDFVKNDFQTIEQQNFKNQEILTWIAIGVSLILGVFF